MPSVSEDIKLFLNDLYSWYDMLTDRHYLLLVTLDIASLFTLILNDLGIEYVRSSLTMLGHMFNNKVYLVCALHEFILEISIFIFHDNFYLQKLGVTMVNVCANSYAAIVLAYWEHEYIHNNNPFVCNLCYYKHFVDDRFIIWRSTVESLHQFVDYLI